MSREGGVGIVVDVTIGDIGELDIGHLQPLDLVPPPLPFLPLPFLFLKCSFQSALIRKARMGSRNTAAARCTDTVHGC